MEQNNQQELGVAGRRARPLACLSNTFFRWSWVVVYFQRIVVWGCHVAVYTAHTTVHPPHGSSSS